MKIERENLIAQIIGAFENVTLMGGVGLCYGQVLDERVQG